MKKYIQRFITVIAFFCIFSTTVFADTGPKPSVRITLEGLSNELCYGTLLCARESTGPESAWNGTDEDIRTGDLDYDIWKAFVDYEDSDGYYFLQLAWLVSNTGELNWTYYPPSPFKLLLYYPATNTFAVSEIYEKYAFDSYFTVDVSGLSLYGESTISLPELKKSYDYSGELISLICRIFITVFLELLIALPFRLTGQKQFRIIICVNLITQTALNLLLNIINYKNGSLAFTFYYIFLELAVFLVEGTAYSITINRHSDSKAPVWLYSFTANLSSFIGGFLLAYYIPGIF